MCLPLLQSYYIPKFLLNNVFSTLHEANRFKEMEKVADVTQARVYPKTGLCFVVRDEEEGESWQDWYKMIK